jgi:LPXTG-motif cell wall-anchored protein
MFVLATPLKATPYSDINVGGWLGDGRWGVWRMRDVPPDGVDWLMTDSSTEFKTYWFLGFGRYVTIRVSQGTAVSLLIIALLASGGYVYWRKKRTRSSASSWC